MENIATTIDQLKADIQKVEADVTKLGEYLGIKSEVPSPVPTTEGETANLQQVPPTEGETTETVNRIEDNVNVDKLITNIREKIKSMNNNFSQLATYCQNKNNKKLCNSIKTQIENYNNTFNRIENIKDINELTNLDNGIKNYKDNIKKSYKITLGGKRKTKKTRKQKKSNKNKTRK